MNNEQEIFAELGNRLLQVYCNNKIQDIRGLSKSDFRDRLLFEIGSKWKLSWSYLPDEETFYRAFKKGQSSTGMREKMALLYYACTDEKVAGKMNAVYELLAARQRISIFHYWDRFKEEVSCDLSIPKVNKKVGREDFELNFEYAQKEIESMKALLHQALHMAQKKDALMADQFTLLKQQRLADDRRIRQLESEVKAFINHRPVERKDLKKAEKYFISGNYSAYQKVLDKSMEGNLERIAQTYYLKAKGFEATLQYKNALKAYETAHNLQPKNTEYLNALGHFLYLIADYEAALHVLRKAMKSKDITSPLRARILDNIGSVYREKDNFDIAIRYFEKALTINTKIHGERNDEVAANLNNIGLSLMDKADYDKAISLYSRALNIRKSILGNSHPEIATILSHWGLALKSKGDFKEAIKKYKLAITIAQKEFGRHHPHVANYLNNIAEIWREQSKNDDAIKYYAEAIHIYESIFPSGHPRIAGFLNNMGAAWKEKGDFKKGIFYYKKSLALNYKLFGQYNITIGHNYNNLGLAYHVMGDNALAMANYQSALKVYKKLYKNGHPDIAKVYSNMGGVFHDQKLYGKAIQSYTRAKEMYQRYFSNTHISLAFPIANMARVYDEKQDYDTAIRTYNIALKIFKRTLGPASINIGHVYNNLGQTWYSKGNQKRALTYYGKALSLFTHIVGPKNHYTLKCKKELERVRQSG